MSAPPEQTSGTHPEHARSMYALLLDAALRDSPDAEADGKAFDDALAELHRRRRRLAPRTAGAHGAARAVADQVGYDVALIQVARLLGTDCGTEGFEQPAREREHLEALITAHGVVLDEDDGDVEDLSDFPSDPGPRPLGPGASLNTAFRRGR